MFFLDVLLGVYEGGTKMTYSVQEPFKNGAIGVYSDGTKV